MWTEAECDLWVVCPPDVAGDRTLEAIDTAGLASHVRDESVWEYESADGGWLSFLVDHERVVGIDIARLTPGLAVALNRFMDACGCSLRSEARGARVLVNAGGGDSVFAALCRLELPTEPIDRRRARSTIEVDALGSLMFWWTNNRLNDGAEDAALARALDDAFFAATGARALIPNPANAVVTTEALADMFGTFQILFRGWRDPPPHPHEQPDEGPGIRWMLFPEEPADGGEVWLAYRDIGRLRLVWATDAHSTNNRWDELVRILESVT